MRKIIFSTSFLAIIACLLWATPFTAIKIGLEHSTPLNFAGTRFFLSGILLLPFIGNLKSVIKNLRENYLFILSVAFFQTSLLYGLFYSGVDLVPGALGAMLIGAQPLFATVMAHFFLKNDKMSWKKIIAIFIGVIGVSVISFGNKDFSYKSTIPLGIIILILNNMVGSYGNIIVSKYAKKTPPIMLASLSMLIGGLILIIFSNFVEKVSFNFNLPINYWISLIWLSIVSASSISIWFSLLGRNGVKVSNLNTWKFIIPLFGACLSWLILPNETPDLVSIIGMLIITCSLILVNYLNRMAAK